MSPLTKYNYKITEGTGMPVKITVKLIRENTVFIILFHRSTNGARFRSNFKTMSNIYPAIPHLLLIDDDEDEIRILSDALAEAVIDCQCTWAMGPQHGLAILKYFTPQFIFMDYRMPKMNGIECIEAIRETHGLTEVPIILYSSEINKELADKAYAAGAMACVKKTGNIQELSHELADLFSNRIFTDQMNNLRL